MVNTLYVVWIKFNETLPWIELEGDYKSREEARKAAQNILDDTVMKIVEISERKKEYGHDN